MGRRRSWEGRLAVIPTKSNPAAAPKLSDEEQEELDSIVQETMFPKRLRPALEQIAPFLKHGNSMINPRQQYLVSFNHDKELTCSEHNWSGPLDLTGYIAAPAGIIDELLQLPPELDEKVRNIIMFKDQYNYARSVVDNFVSHNRNCTPKQMVAACPEMEWIIRPEELKGRATTRPLKVEIDTTELRAALSFIRLMGGL